MTMLDVQMGAELKAAPEAVKRQEQVLSVTLAPLVARLRRKPPQVVADETVSGEPVSAFNFPARREIGRVFDIF
jgi:hypothetical protein